MPGSCAVEIRSLGAERAAGRTAGGQRDLKDRSREPSPLCVSHSGRLLMSVNPTLTPWIPLSADPKAKPVGGSARPEFLEFDPAHPEQVP